MTEKRFTDIEHDYENARIRCKDNGMFMLYAIYENDDGLPTLGDLLNEQDTRIKELEDKLNQTALFFLNYNMITMGKAVEISEMSYFDFLKYRKENGNPMELQL